MVYVCAGGPKPAIASAVGIQLFIDPVPLSVTRNVALCAAALYHHPLDSQ
jgi:hypothetical protein